MPQATPQSMSDALNRLWARFLPETMHRLEILESAADALAAGALTEEVRQSAHQAAHKLAGSLGTFGLSQGTVLARNAEVLLAKSDPDEALSDLTAWVSEMRRMIDQRSA